MHDTEKAAFRDMMLGVMEVYGKTISKDGMSLWWAALAPLSFDQVRKAMQEHITGDRGTFMPLPADILKSCRGVSGHPAPDEAWAIAVSAQDEYDSVIWTRQIAEALGIARPIMDTGDKVGARMAFLSAYDRITKEGPPIWSISLGIDKVMREVVIDKALRLGRINEAYARQIMPPESNMVLTPTGLLPAPERTPEQIANGLAILAQIKQTFGVKANEA